LGSQIAYFLCDRKYAAGNILPISRIQDAKRAAYHAVRHDSARPTHRDDRQSLRTIAVIWVVNA